MPKTVKDENGEIAGEENLSYEEAVFRLEQIVKQMESGELTLGETVSAYEKGIKLVKYCESELNKYENIIKSLGETGTDCGGEESAGRLRE